MAGWYKHLAGLSGFRTLLQMIRIALTPGRQGANRLYG
jgi:hypothetical protein